MSGVLVPNTPVHRPRTPRKCGDMAAHSTHPPSHDHMRRRMRCRPHGRDHPTLEGATTPFQSTPRSARRGDVRRSLDRPPSRNETIRPRNGARNRTLQPRPLNRETLGARPTPLTIPYPAADRPEHTIERGNHDSQTGPEENDTRVNNEPFHNEAHRATAGATTMRKPVLRTHAARVIERPRKRNTVT